MSETTPAILDVQDLAVSYVTETGFGWRRRRRVLAVEGVSFRLERGEILGLVGESGCGKTTLGKAVMGLVAAERGRLLFERASGETVDLAALTRRAYRPLRSEIQMIYQDPASSLNPRWTAGDIVAEPLCIHRPGLTRAGREAQAAELLGTVGLAPDLARRYPHEFSGGERQRIAIARALATSPRLVIADEPFSAIDAALSAQILHLLDDLGRRGLAMLLIAHDLSMVARSARRIAVMYAGRLCEVGPARAMVERPFHPYTQALLAARDRRRHRHLRGEAPSPLERPPGCAFHPRCPIAEAACAAAVPQLVEVEPERFLACPVAARPDGGPDGRGCARREDQ